MKRISSILFLLVLVIMTSCNTCARKFGGTQTINLPKGEKLITASWKGDQVWYLARPMTADEQPVTSKYREVSNMGVVEGTVIFVESK